MLKLRDYQEDALKAIEKRHADGVSRQLLSLATGAGKTVIFAELIRRRNQPALVLAHTNELLHQAKDKIHMLAPEMEVGIVNGHEKNFDADIVVSSIQSARQPETLAKLQSRNFPLLIADECHHFASSSCRDVLDALGFGQRTSKLLVGFTATPFRSDGLGLGEVFEEVVFEKSIGSLIAEGYLVTPRGVRVSTDLDLRSLAQSQGDYSGPAIAAVMNTSELRELALGAHTKYADGLQTIVFAASVQHAKDLCSAFQSVGVSASTISAHTPKGERESTLSDYAAGKVQVLTNCGVLTEGYDAPNTQCVLVARPTRSRGLYQQMVGRGLRRYPNKLVCIVIDFCDAGHTLCNAAILMPDADAAANQEEERKARVKALKGDLPPNLNRRLQHAYVQANLLGNGFYWKRERQEHVLVGTQGTSLRIAQEKEGTYSVLLMTERQALPIAQGVSFDYAFSAAEDYALDHRSQFILADKQASWRNDPISPGQQKVFKSAGYKSGINHLTKGQASDLISSNALRRCT